MSSVTINGTLILNGSLSCSGNITVTPRGQIIPIPDEELKKEYFIPEANSYIASNGCGRTITSTTGNIVVQGSINGVGLGWKSNRGPGCNSRLTDSTGNPIKGYGATHAGIGYSPLVNAPHPQQPYGCVETPISLGSGSGFYHDPLWYEGVESSGGGAIKIVASSGTITVGGSVLMEGLGSDFAGGGSGGSIWLVGWGIDGTGTLSVRGGESRLTDGTSYTGGGGGGGYVSIWHYQKDTFSGPIRVSGLNGSGDGKVYRHLVEPIFEDKYTGEILNTKWWDSTGGISLFNRVDATSVDTPSYLESNFILSGRDIDIAYEYKPLSTEQLYYHAFLELNSDATNWVRIQRMNGRIWGGSCVDGIQSWHAFPRTNIDTSMRLIKTDSTFYYQFYDSTSIAPVTIYSDPLPEIKNDLFSVRIGVDQLHAVDSIRTDYCRLNSGNIRDMRVDMEGDPPAIPALNVINGAAQMYGADFYSSGTYVAWDGAGLFGTHPISLVQDYFVLTAYDVYQKQITLNSIPRYPNNVALNVVYGSSQEYGVDYIIIGDKLLWGGLGLDGGLIEGDILRVTYDYDPWYRPVPLYTLLEVGDMLRITYGLPITGPSNVYASFDSVRIYAGTIDGELTTEPVVYVDSVRGSDSSSGTQLEPLKNLFVASAWSQNGGTVVLYDGTYNPVEVYRKNLTIRGADGANPLVTSAYSLDTTGAGWENTAFRFIKGQGLIDNIQIKDTSTGILIDQSPEFEVRNMRISNVQTGIRAIECDPLILRNAIHDCTTGMDFTDCSLAYVNSNVVYACTTAIRSDTTGLVITGNTLDGCGTAVRSDIHTHGVIASNNITNDATGITSIVPTVSSYYNNFYNTPVPYIGMFQDSSADFTGNPLYYDYGNKNFHIVAGSPDINAGTFAFDRNRLDRDAMPRTTADVGAYQYNDATHTGTDWYVAGYGDDVVNGGTEVEPFRTLDRAMAVADSTIRIQGGHYDSYFLRLRSQSVDLQQLSIISASDSSMVNYFVVTAQDASNGYMPLPNFITHPSDSSNVAMNIVGGPAQMYDLDYIIQGGNLVWAGYRIDGLVGAGDIVRLIYSGPVYRRALNTLVLHSHYPNVDVGNMIICSPAGSDSTVMGGDGTNSGGNGTWQKPFRTVQAALNVSNPGSYIILKAGEYPMFPAGLDNRVLIPFYDKTNLTDGKDYIQDFFAPTDFRPYGMVYAQEIPWDFSYAGRSKVNVDAGYLAMSYDGSNQPTATSTFTMTGNWEVRAVLQNSIDPITMMVSGADDTLGLRYDNTDYSAFVTTAGNSYRCMGTVGNPGQRNAFVVDHIIMQARDIRDKGFALSFLPESTDMTNVALNFVGGTPQMYGEDFVVCDGRVEWDGLELDGQVEVTDIARVMYVDRGLAGPVGVMLSMKNGLFEAKVYDNGWRRVSLRNMYGDSSSWKVSFFMSDPDVSVSHNCSAGKGFVSQFYAVADGITGASSIGLHGAKTHRKSVLFYNI